MAGTLEIGKLVRGQSAVEYLESVFSGIAAGIIGGICNGDVFKGQGEGGVSGLGVG